MHMSLLFFRNYGEEVSRRNKTTGAWSEWWEAKISEPSEWVQSSRGTLRWPQGGDDSYGGESNTLLFFWDMLSSNSLSSTFSHSEWDYRCVPPYLTFSLFFEMRKFDIYTSKKNSRMNFHMLHVPVTQFQNGQLLLSHHLIQWIIVFEAK
jgi:hypothetical protein